MKILVTGGAGFIGSNFILYMLDKYPNYKIVNLDALTYAGNLNNTKEFKSNNNYTFVLGNIQDISAIEKAAYDCDAIINFAAESHVDNSINNPIPFLFTNIIGTVNILEYLKKEKNKKFIQISTDEVYGSLDNDGFFTELSQIQPNSPYSASKASADHLVRAYHETWGLDVNVTRCSNNYGPKQHPEKFIPTIIKNIIENKSIPIYGDGSNIRDWLHVMDHAAAIDSVLHRGKSGEVYNIGGNNEKTNIEVVNKIIELMNIKNSKIEFVKDRLGHDKRYAIDSNKIKNELKWKPKYDFNLGLQQTIEWYVNNEK